MAAIAQLQATKQPPIPFKALLNYEEYPTTRLVHRVALPPPAAALAAATAANAPTPDDTIVLKKQDTTFCPDSTDKERLIRVIEDFIDAADKSNLDIHDTDRHKKARNVFGGDLKHSWDAVIAGNANLKDADFLNNIRTFLGMFLPSNAFLIQQEYMLHAIKPFYGNE
eukprot:CAMPEP_0172395118 /NCGR_PEP_ID=MMETSP1061-20121228/18225_1 /TAXON_ID=37318 /ORGANISM="Pseudo-nitzschia pungens, Strain cf. pungens" /LENGTH=167 /DNA_ID=CAMNT_0013126607 /DNA_START=47 /DNA_END=550 /DNA_ORIENTATION=-